MRRIHVEIDVDLDDEVAAEFDASDNPEDVIIDHLASGHGVNVQSFTTQAGKETA